MLITQIKLKEVLFLFIDSQNKFVCSLIDKDLNVFLLNINADDSYYNYTIFDVVFDIEENNITILDTYISCGYKVNKIVTLIE